MAPTSCVAELRRGAAVGGGQVVDPLRAGGGGGKGPLGGGDGALRGGGGSGWWVVAEGSNIKIRISRVFFLFPQLSFWYCFVLFFFVFFSFAWMRGEGGGLVACGSEGSL